MSKSSKYTSDMTVICVTCGVEFGRHFGNYSFSVDEFECPLPDPKNAGNFIRTPKGQPIRWWRNPKDVLVNKSVAEVAPEKTGTGPAVNDHVCPTCKNDRCSKQEKTCWRCGNKL